MCSRPRTHGEWGSGAVLWCGFSRGGADEKRRVPDSGGLGVLVMTEFTGSVLVKW